MKIGFIGAGKVGFSFGKYFTINNIPVSGYYSRNIDTAIEAANFTNTNYFKSISDLVTNSDVIFITTPDDVISEIWNEIKNLSVKNKVICHCSGALSSKIFSNRENHNIYGYSTHPIYAFSDKYNSYKNLNEAIITIEGDEEKIQVVKDIFNATQNKIKVISWEIKSLYHAAAVFGSNHVIALAETGISLLIKCGFTYDEAVKSLYPLMLNNIKSIGNVGIVKSLTGPLERGDIKTIANHLEVLDEEDRELYKLLSKKLIKIAKTKNPGRDYMEIEKVIGD